MTVRELIEALGKVNPDALVITADSFGGHAGPVDGIEACTYIDGDDGGIIRCLEYKHEGAPPVPAVWIWTE